MLTPGKDYSLISSFELRAYSLTRTNITTPPEACTKGVQTAASFFRCRLVSKRIQIQTIAWTDILDPTKWANATNAFVDIIGADVDQWDIVPFSDTKLLVAFQKTGEDFCRHKIYTDGAGWAADVRNGISATPPMTIYGIPYYGHVEIGLTGGVQATLNFRSQTSDPNITQSILGDPTINYGVGFYSKSPMLLTRNTNSEHRIYYPLSYTVGMYGYTWHMKWGRTAATPQFKVVGDTLLSYENTKVSQGYNPFYMRTLYNFIGFPDGKYNNNYYTLNGNKSAMTSTSLGQISEFSQDWKKFKCKVPNLDNAYNELSTVYLRRNFTDGSYIDSNPMIVENYHTDIFSNNIFECSKIWDAPAYSPLLHHVAESQPHLLFTHSLPYCPVAVKNQGTSIYNLLERYKLVMSHDQAQLLIKDNVSPVGTLDYDLYKTDYANSKAINLMYMNDDLTLVPDLISGDQPTGTHSLGFLTGNITRTNLVKNYAFGFKRMTFEQPPQYFQVGDVVTIDAQAGMIDDIQESFSQAKWRQTLTALVA